MNTIRSVIKDGISDALSQEQTINPAYFNTQMLLDINIQGV